MPRISRRRFFQFTGSALASLGLSQLNLKRQAERYGKVLAQETPRKVALLVGINNYSSAPLRGCVNDMELQRLSPWISESSDSRGDSATRGTVAESVGNISCRGVV